MADQLCAPPMPKQPALTSRRAIDLMRTCTCTCCR